ncbi:hypothetical protein QFZ54_000692 [Sphingomonas faeni]|nr:hypothetical protein [Sphingomonas faeni]
MDDDPQTSPGIVCQHHTAADLLDIGTYHVHAYATARPCRNRITARQSRSEDQFRLRRLAHRGEFGLIIQSLFDSLCDDPGDVYAPPIIADLDEYLVARLTRGYNQTAGFGLSRHATGRRGLDAVIDRFANYMDEWIAHQFNHLAVELDIGPLDHEVHRLAQLRAGIAYHPWQYREQRLDFCMRVRVTVSRMSTTVSDSAFECRLDLWIDVAVAEPAASSLRASTMSDMPLIM